MRISNGEHVGRDSLNKDIEPGICTIFCPDNEKLSSKGAVSNNSVAALDSRGL